MATLEVEIKSQEDAIEYARQDPDKALGVVVWNLIRVKENCECRLGHCQAVQKKSRLKNIALQGAAGFAGGASAVWAMFIVFKEYIAALKDLIKP